MKAGGVGGLHLGLTFALFVAVFAGYGRAEGTASRRVIALGGSVTEIVVALGQEHLLVAL